MTTSTTRDTLPTYFISHGGGPWPWMKKEMGNAYAHLEAALADMPRQIGKRGFELRVGVAHLLLHPGPGAAAVGNEIGGKGVAGGRAHGMLLGCQSRDFP